MPTPANKAPIGLHPRNRHQGRYDFPALIKSCPALAAFVIRNPYGKQSIDFANPAAVRVFNRALLAQLYGIQHWDIPADYLCPPVPGRADYLHGLADLLASDHQGQLLKGPQVQVLDIGTGANCIYPLLGHSDYGWHFTAADIDPVALASAQKNLQANQLQSAVELRLQEQAKHIFEGVIEPEDRFSLTLCNPPFHSSAHEAQAGSQRKWKNLGKLDPQRKLPVLNFGGQSNELWCPGGEVGFLRRMAKESQPFAPQVLWFSSLVSKAGNVRDLRIALNKAGAKEIRCINMAQGNKQSRFVAWSFHDAQARQQWLQSLS